MPKIGPRDGWTLSVRPGEHPQSTRVLCPFPVFFSPLFLLVVLLLLSSSCSSGIYTSETLELLSPSAFVWSGVCDIQNERRSFTQNGPTVRHSNYGKDVGEQENALVQSGLTGFHGSRFHLKCLYSMFFIRLSSRGGNLFRRFPTAPDRKGWLAIG